MPVARAEVGTRGWRTGLEIDAWDYVGLRAELDERAAKSRVGCG